MSKIKVTFPVKFECQPDCVNCCTISDGFVFLTESEAVRIADFLELSEDEFLTHFTRAFDDQLVLVDNSDDRCIFLEGNKCSIYEVRPMQCRTYPFWSQNLKTQNRWHIVSQECPGIGKGSIYSVADIEQILKGRSLNSKR